MVNAWACAERMGDGHIQLSHQFQSLVHHASLPALCTDCGKTFTRADNLKRHACRAFNPPRRRPSEQIKIRMVRIKTFLLSLLNVFCESCQIRVSEKGYGDHVRSQVHRDRDILVRDNIVYISNAIIRSVKVRHVLFHVIVKVVSFDAKY